MTAAPRLDPDRLRRARAYRELSLWTDLASTATGVGVLVALHVLEIGVLARHMVNPMELPYTRPRPIADRVRALGLRWEELATRG